MKKLLGLLLVSLILNTACTKKQGETWKVVVLAPLVILGAGAEGSANASRGSGNGTTTADWTNCEEIPGASYTLICCEHIKTGKTLCVKDYSH